MNVAHRVTPTLNSAGSTGGHRLSFRIVPVDFSTVRCAQLLPTEAQRRQLLARGSHMSTVTSVPSLGNSGKQKCENLTNPCWHGTLFISDGVYFHLLQVKRKGEAINLSGFGLCVDPRLLEFSVCLGCAAHFQFPALCKTLHCWAPLEIVSPTATAGEFWPQKWDKTAVQETKVAKQLWLYNCEGFLLLHHCYRSTISPVLAQKS